MPVSNPIIAQPPPPLGPTRLIDRPGIKVSYTANQETDTRTAMTRGLKEYLEQLKSESSSGQQVLFKHVFSTWAEPEDEANYPCAAVLSDPDAVYASAKFTPTIIKADAVDEVVDMYLSASSEMELDMKVIVQATNPEQRMWAVAMTEAEMNPVDWKYGFDLELPFYFNTRATYEMVSMRYEDSETASRERRRNAIFTVKGRLTVCKLMKRPKAQIRVKTETK